MAYNILMVPSIPTYLVSQCAVFPSFSCSSHAETLSVFSFYMIFIFSVFSTRENSSLSSLPSSWEYFGSQITCHFLLHPYYAMS